jgi:hypothetical protein
MSPVMNGVPPLRDLAAEQQVEHMVTNLRLLNDTLASTAMAGRYWMFAGLVLGWAREGKLLSHDCKDADFAYLGDDEELLQSAFPILAEAGFQPMFRFPSVDGPATEYCLEREGLRFDFFRLELDGDRLRYFNYGYAGPDWTQPSANECVIPAQPLEEIRYLGRTWLKARDHDAELTALYGDWRTPDKGWDYMKAPSVVAQRPWDDSDHRWDGC